MPDAASVLDRPRAELPAASGRLRWWTLLAIALGTFMTYLDNNVINVAIPSIQRDLHLSASGIEWVVSGYILAFAGLMLAGGRLGDVAGHRRVFLMGLTLFTGASLMAGLSADLHVLVASRALQGVGAAMLTPTGLAIITYTFPEPGEQARAIGLWAAVGALALAVGPLLGGVLSQHLSWHWIFFINVPIGVITLALGTRVILEGRQRERRRLDLPGVSASTGALIGLTYALIQGPNSGWTDGVVLAGFALAAVLGTLFVAIERRVTHPMLDLSVFRSRSFSGGIMALGLWAFGLFGIYFFTSLYLQDVLGFSASKAGVAFVPMAMLMAAGAAISDRVAPRVGAHRLVGAAMALMGLGILSVSLLGRHATFGDLMPGFAVIGIGGGLTIPLTSTVVSAMPAERAGVASATFNASREVSGLLGITVIGVILSARQHAELRLGHSNLGAFLSGYRLGLVVAGALVIAGGGMAFAALRQVTPVKGPDAVDPAQE